MVPPPGRFTSVILCSQVLATAAASTSITNYILVYVMITNYCLFGRNSKKQLIQCILYNTRSQVSFSRGFRHHFVIVHIILYSDFQKMKKGGRSGSSRCTGNISSLLMHRCFAVSILLMIVSTGPV